MEMQKNEFKKHNYPLLLFFINALPLIHIFIGICFIINITDIYYKCIFSLLWVYILPPIICRGVLILFKPPVGTDSTDSFMYRSWWFLSQLQMLFNRLPFLEELLRFIPGLYSLWLNLWGSHASLLIFWSPGVRILDRHLVTIGPKVVLGWNCRISCHTFTEKEDGTRVLILAPVIIDKNAMIGGHAKISAGCHIYPGEIVPSTQLMTPFNDFKDGKRQTRK